MIGNDIVDFRQAAKDSNWKRPRFLAKVFTQREQSIILSSTNKGQMVWLLWSMKEAAYKAYVRECKDVFFNPKRIECQLNLNHEGVVWVDKNMYYLKSLITSEYVHSIAMKTLSKHSETHLFKLANANQSETVRAKIVRYVSSKRRKDLSSIRLKKTALGVPNLFLNNEQIYDALSISHHGKFGAFVIC